MRQYAFGVDIGGTTVKMGLMETDGTLCEVWEIPTRIEDDGSRILEDVSGQIRGMADKKHLAPEQIAGIGIGVPGPVGADGTVYECVNLGWGTFNVEKEMRNLTGFRTKAANDANTAALGEMWMGGGKEYRDMVMVTLGTGVGGGIILDGRIVPGFCGAAGEIGHITVNWDETERCGCGRRGCLEQYASASGVARIAKKFLMEHDDPSLLRERPDCDVTAKDVFDAAKKQDSVALSLVDDFGRVTARGLAQVACIVNPEVFVIGGGMAEAGQIVIDVIRKHFAGYAFHADMDTRFVLAALGNHAGIFGDVKMILDETVSS